MVPARFLSPEASLLLLESKIKFANSILYAFFAFNFSEIVIISSETDKVLHISRLKDLEMYSVRKKCKYVDFAAAHYIPLQRLFKALFR